MFPTDYYREVVTARNYLFISGMYSIQIFDLSDPCRPELVQFLPFSSWPDQMVLEGDYLYVAAEYGFYIFKINWPPVDCGDANADGTVNVSDAVFIINYIFAGGVSPYDYASGDVNCDEIVNISDAVWIINYIFAGGKQPCDTDGDGTPDC